MPSTALMPYGIMVLGIVMVLCGLTFSVEDEKPKGEKLARILDLLLGMVTGVPMTLAGGFMFFGLAIFVVGILLLVL